VPRKPGEAILNHLYKKRQRAYNASRPARHKFYNTKQWRTTRQLYISRHPLCEVCMKNGIIKEAEIVHHVKELSDGGDPISFDNLQSLCKPCHNRLHGGRGG